MVENIENKRFDEKIHRFTREEQHIWAITAGVTVKIAADVGSFYSSPV